MVNPSHNTDSLKVFSGDESPEDLSSLRLQERLQWECHSGSFEEAFRQRDSLFVECLTITGVDAEDVQEKTRVTGDAILEYLRKHNAVLRLAGMDISTLQDLQNGCDRIAMNIHLTPLMRGTTNPQLPDENIDRHIQNCSALLVQASEAVINSEQVIIGLRQQGIFIRHGDIVRLIAYDINEHKIIPRILLLKNPHDPSKPLLVLVEDPESAKDQLRDLLSVYDR